MSKCSSAYIAPVCVARFDPTANQIICGLPDIKRVSPDDILLPSQKAERMASGRCLECGSYKRAVEIMSRKGLPAAVQP